MCSQASILPPRIDEEWNAATKDMQWNYTTGERNLSDAELTAAAAGCGGKIPYAQADDDGTGGTQLRSKFTRFKPTTVWSPATTEEKRHAFAVGTCSGCHAAETGTLGFHVTPGLPGQNATLSAFLSSKVTATPKGTTYTYDEPSRRMDLLQKFLDGVDVPGDMLHTLDCFDADKCKVQ